MPPTCYNPHEASGLNDAFSGLQTSNAEILLMAVSRISLRFPYVKRPQTLAEIVAQP